VTLEVMVSAFALLKTDREDFVRVVRRLGDLAAAGAEK
jgi:hypothetical protein